MGDEIWQLHAKVAALTAKSEGDTKRVLRLALNAIETAGAMEDRKTIRRIDETLRN